MKYANCRQCSPSSSSSSNLSGICRHKSHLVARCCWLMAMLLILANTHKLSSCFRLIACICHWEAETERRSRRRRTLWLGCTVALLLCVCVCLIVCLLTCNNMGHAPLWTAAYWDSSSLFISEMFTRLFTQLAPDSGPDLVSSRTCHCVRLLWRDASFYICTCCKQTGMHERGKRGRERERGREYSM